SEAANGAKQVSTLLFGREADAVFVQSLSTASLDTIAKEIPSYSVLFPGGEINIADLLAGLCPVFSSKSEVRKAIQNNAVSINKVKITSHEHVVKGSDFLHDQYLLVENGKKNKYLLKRIKG